MAAHLETHDRSPKEIFLDALDISSAGDQRAFLDRLCGEDSLLRFEVEALLRHHGRLGDYLEPPALDPEATQDCGVSSREPDIQSVIGPYKLLEQIGEGGMGSVYVAEQTEPVRRRVALKVIKPGMDTKQVLARFEAERQALAMMDHPNIAKVHDAGATAEGRPYFVMELVKGIAITDYCDQARLSIPERLDLFVLVCRAVQHAHQKGIIHRDLKPSNILVTVIDGAAVPKVIDFGIAKSTGAQLTDRSVYTGFAQMIGTPLYMSPEQAELSGVDVDTRSDVYALGVLLYELLTGTTPIDRDTLVKAAYDEIRRVVCEQEPPTPSTRLGTLGESLSSVSANRRSDTRKLGQSVRGELDWIVMKALEKDRNRRYESANDFAADVMRHLTDQPVEACPPSPLYTLQKFLRRHRSRVAAVGMIAVLGFALAGAVAWQAIERANRRAETAGAASQALDAAERWVSLAKWPDAMASAKQAEVLLSQGGDEALRKRVRNLSKDLAMVLRLDEIRQEMSVVRNNTFDTGLGDRLYAEAFRGYGIDVDALEPSALASKMPGGPVREELVAALDDWARVRREKKIGDERGWKSLLAAARAADPDPWRDRVREAWMRGDRKALNGLARSAPLDRLHPCVVILLQSGLNADQAVVVLRKAQQRHPGDFWINHALATRLVREMNPPRPDEGIGFFRAALASRPANAGISLNLGYALQMAGRGDEAIAAFEQATRLKPDYDAAFSNLGNLLTEKGRFEEAVVACREAIRLKPDSAIAHVHLGNALSGMGSLDEAITAYREAIRLNPGDRLAPYNLGKAYYKKGEMDEAIAAYREAIRAAPGYAEAHCNLGHALWEKDQLREALAALRRGHELGSKRPGWSYPSASWIEECETLLAAQEATQLEEQGKLSPKRPFSKKAKGESPAEPRKGGSP